jgi:2-oxoisovalerate dehydrogenase E1 component beta subunit
MGEAITYLEAIRQGLWEEMERDERVFMLGEDIGVYGGAFKVTKGFLEKFGQDRIIDTPIAESAIVGAAIGASLMGMRPVAEMQFIDFIACAFNQITNFAAKSRWRYGAGVPIVIRGPSGGGVRGGPFHSQNTEMYYVHTPGLKVVAPGTTYDAKGLIKAAIRDEDPVIYLEHKYLYRLPRIKEVLPEEDYVVPIGKAALRREGKDISLSPTAPCSCSGCRRGAGEGGGQRRSAGSPHPASAGCRGHRENHQKNGEGPHRPRGHAHGRHCRRNHRPHQ